MIVWLIITVVLLIWNAVYCSLKIVADLRGPKPASGVWGMFALAGVLSMKCAINLPESGHWFSYAGWVIVQVRDRCRGR